MAEAAEERDGLDGLTELIIMARMWREWLRANAAASSTHHEAEVARMRRMAAAKAVGIDPVHFDVPFPGTSQTVINMSNNDPPAPATPAVIPPATPPAAGPSPLAKGLALALGGAVLAGGGAGITALALKQPVPIVSTQPTLPATTAPALIPWISQDGGKTWQRLTPPTGK